MFFFVTPLLNLKFRLSLMKSMMLYLDSLHIFFSYLMSIIISEPTSLLLYAKLERGKKKKKAYKDEGLYSNSDSCQREIRSHVAAAFTAELCLSVYSNQGVSKTTTC